MKTSEFLQQLDDANIVGEIARAEKSTSGEIRVFVSEKEVDDVISRAEQRFKKLGMNKTTKRNAVLLYFAPRSQKFAVIGDVGIHQKCDPAFWQEIVAEIRPQLMAGNFAEGVKMGVEKVGKVLSRYFPSGSDNDNELSNEILGE